jgi:uncharacterized caspase-like protein
MTLDIDLPRSRAVLLGVSFFPRDSERLPALPSVRNNLRDLSRLLADPEVMGFDSRHIVVVDDRPSSEMLSRLAEVAVDAEDTLVVYYAGHGLIGGTQLYLTGSDSSERMIEFDGMPFERLRKALNASPARKRILILDCCYSGRAAELMGTTKAMLQANIEDIEGAYVLASSGGTEAAVAPEGARHTAFTGELVRILEHGIEGAAATLRLSEMYRELLLSLRRNPKLPEPQQSASKTVGEMGFAHNRAFVPKATEAAPDRAPRPPPAAAEELGQWHGDLVDRLEQQAQIIEALQRRVAQHSPAQAGSFAHSEAAQGVAEDQAALVRQSSDHPDREMKTYFDLLEKQQTRIAELERALTRLQRPPPVPPRRSGETKDPSKSPLRMRFGLSLAEFAHALVGFSKPDFPPPRKPASRTPEEIRPDTTATRCIGLGAQVAIIGVAFFVQAAFIGVMMQIAPQGPITTSVAEDMALISGFCGGAGLLCWSWLLWRYHKSHPLFCSIALPHFTSMQAVGFVSALLYI